MRFFASLLACAALVFMNPALAQTTDEPDTNVYNDVDWQGVAGRLHGAVRGTITAVQGHLLTVRRATNTIVINDQPALNRKLTGNVYTGRDIVAVGYWEGGTFYATTIEDANAPDAGATGIPDFGAYGRVPDRLTGTITSVNGSQVMLQQSTRTIVVNDQPALNRQMTGVVAVGRSVIADGYWLHGTFFVTSFASAS
jgi:hypothetical protein